MKDLKSMFKIIISGIIANSKIGLTAKEIAEKISQNTEYAISAKAVANHLKHMVNVMYTTVKKVRHYTHAEVKKPLDVIPPAFNVLHHPVLILDTEGRKKDHPQPTQVGYVRFENNVITKQQHLFFETPKDIDSGGKPIDEVLNGIHNKQIPISEVENVIKAENVSAVFVYGENGYDKNALRHCSKNKQWVESITFYDVLTLFKRYVNKEKYYRFLRKYKKRDKRSPHALQNAYAFITNDYNYKQQHTATSDAIITLEVLKYCIYRYSEMAC